MDNLAAQISNLLESPDGMDKIREMASMLMTPEPQQAPPPAPDNSSPDIDMDKLQRYCLHAYGTTECGKYK